MDKKKKILIVSRSFFPQSSPRSFRTTELAKEFARQGHSVTVITPKHESHTVFAQTHGIKIKWFQSQLWKPIPLKQGGATRIFWRLLKRFSNLLFQYPDIQLLSVIRKALQSEEGYDLLVSIAVPHPVHWAVARTRSKLNPIAKTWVADCGDPFMGQENDSFKYPFYFKYVEKWFCAKADYITVPTTGAIDAYYPEFRNKIKVIPQGFRFEDFSLEYHAPDNSKPMFAYAGMFIPGRRDPSELLKFLVETDIEFEFRIYTSMGQMVRPYAERSGGRIIVHDYIARTELLRALSKMDFLVNFENVGTRQTPSKLIDYAIVQRPVLSIATGKLDKSAVLNFLRGDYHQQLVIDRPEQFRIENVARQFLELA
jgi:hypothetical protein